MQLTFDASRREQMNRKLPAISVGEGLAILANIGVVIGLIFVWAELRQNKMQLNAEVELSMAAAYVEIFAHAAENDHVAELFITAYQDPESLSQVQYLQLMSIHAEWMALVYATWKLHASGVIDERTWLYHSSQYLYFLETRWMQEFWRGMIHEGMYPPDFLEQLESRLPTPRS